MGTQQNNILIIRDRNASTRSADKTNDWPSFKRQNLDMSAFGDGCFASSVPKNSSINITRNNLYNGNTLPQIAIKRKDNDSPSSVNTEVHQLKSKIIQRIFEIYFMKSRFRSFF